ncbi:hypothetical protein K1X12_03780 [Hyphomonas sp. WL0036]|uniref:hypothetical protein n=1 Tax=Hyphomonas sediminis TaxID=2866160 RepID=UPI001C81BB65|nr:hypothetical protein [Hyphomonas sediminis]MBY9066002.1 hypothetical protein [Hyphomonas sediminis]
MIRTVAMSAIALLSVSGVAGTDEVWTTPVGEVVYEQDLDTGEAVLSFPGESGERLLGVFPEMAGVTEGRVFFGGYWVDPDAREDGPCMSAMADPINGGATYAWGRVDLIFVEPDFPARFVALKGNCFDQPTDFLVAEPVVGE